MIKRILKAIRCKLNPPIRKCICGEHYCCFRHNYRVVGDGKAQMRPRAIKCKRFRESVIRLQSANLTRVH